MNAYRPFELHTHTQHSDGRFLTDELLRACAAYGYQGMALTDHNALTANDDVTPALVQETGIQPIPGIEWTTFFGHLLVLGCNRYVDWRFVTPDTIDAALAEIQEAGGVAGIAHPCEVGAPLMCGCHWEFNVTRWDLISYIELWSEDDPHHRSKNMLALPWYDQLLCEGHRLAISAGRDWHAADNPQHPPLLSATYLGVAEGDCTPANALAALRAGRSYITLGPTLEISLLCGDKSYDLGETAPAGDCTLTVTLAADKRQAIWQSWDIVPTQVRIVHNGETTAQIDCAADGTVRVPLTGTRGWLRAEVLGTYRGSEGTARLAITSPIYFD